MIYSLYITDKNEVGVFKYYLCGNYYIGAMFWLYGKTIHKVKLKTIKESGMNISTEITKEQYEKILINNNLQDIEI